MKISKQEKIKRIKKIYSLFYDEKMSAKDISEELKIGKKTVYRYLEIIRLKNGLNKLS